MLQLLWWVKKIHKSFDSLNSIKSLKSYELLINLPKHFRQNLILKLNKPKIPIFKSWSLPKIDKSQVKKFRL